MAQEVQDFDPSTSGVLESDQNEQTIKLVRLPKVVLNRIDEKTLLQLEMPTNSKNSQKRITKLSEKVQNVLKGTPKKNDNTDVVKRPRGRPRKTDSESALSMFKKNTLKLGSKSKTLTANKKSPLVKKTNLNVGVNNKSATSNKKLFKEDVNIRNKSGNLLKKTILQKRSKVVIPQSKKTKVSFPNKIIKPKSPTEGKQNPPKPKLEIIQSTLGNNSSDSSDDEFLYDELIEEIKNTSNKRVVEAKAGPEKTTITLKPNAGNKPPTVLKGGIVKRTDLPSNLNLFGSPSITNSKVIANGLQKAKLSTPLTSGGKRKNSDAFGQPGPAKKSSPWPVSLAPSPKKSPASGFSSYKKKDLSKIAASQLGTKPKAIVSAENTYSPRTGSSPEPIYQPKSITLGMPKPKIGPKQTAKVVPLSKSFGSEDYLSDEYLEEETLDCDLEVVHISKASSQTTPKSKLSTTDRASDQNANHDLLKILTDDSEEPMKAKSTEVIEKPVVSKLDLPTSGKEEVIMQVPIDTRLDAPSEQTKDVENEEAPVRTIYDLMNEVFLEYPSWNLHIIPETSAFCIAQVTKGRLGLPTLKKCIELDAVNYSAKVYIHQYHIKRFDGIYDGEESILALIREIDSIKA